MSTPLLLVFKKQPEYLVAWVNHDGDELCKTFKQTKIEELESLYERLLKYKNNKKIYVSSIIPNDVKTDDWGLKYDVTMGTNQRWNDDSEDFIGSFRYGEDLTQVTAEKLLDIYYNVKDRRMFSDFSYYCIIDLDREKVGSSGYYQKVPKMVRCGRKSNFDGKNFGGRSDPYEIGYKDIRGLSTDNDYEDADSFHESQEFEKAYKLLKENGYIIKEEFSELKKLPKSVYKKLLANYLGISPDELKSRTANTYYKCQVFQVGDNGKLWAVADEETAYKCAVKRLVDDFENFPTDSLLLYLGEFDNGLGCYDSMGAFDEDEIMEMSEEEVFDNIEKGRMDLNYYTFAREIVNNKGVADIIATDGEEILLNRSNKIYAYWLE